MKKSNATKSGIKKEKKDKKTVWMSIFILIIMILSIAGFALMSGGGVSSSPDGTPSEYPLQQIEHEGQVFWYSIRNKEQFIFESVDGYDSDLVAKGLARKIESQDVVSIYVDEGFESSDSLFLVEKALKGIKKPYSRTMNEQCNSNTLVFTNNESLKGDCMKFVSSNEDAYNKAEILVYHLIKE